MSTGCGGGCLGNYNPQLEIQQIREQAKNYAIKNEKTVAIYKEGFEWLFCEYEIALTNQFPITEVLSQHS